MPNAKLFLAAAAAAAIATVAPSAQAQPTIPMPTHDFVQAAAASDQYEILAAQDALTQSHDPDVRAFAQQMIADHGHTSARLAQATMASGLPPPPMGLSDDGAKNLSTLQSLRGADFDHAYVHQQMLAHTSALVVEQGYATSGADPNVRAAARSAVPIIRSHLEMAQRMQP